MLEVLVAPQNGRARESQIILKGRGRFLDKQVCDEVLEVLCGRLKLPFAAASISLANARHVALLMGKRFVEGSLL